MTQISTIIRELQTLAVWDSTLSRNDLRLLDDAIALLKSIRHDAAPATGGDGGAQ